MRFLDFCKASLFLAASTLYAGWSEPASIDAPTTSTTIVSSCYNSSTKQTFAAWADESQIPYYAIYDGTDWTYADTIYDDGVVGLNVFLCSTGSQVFATWAGYISSRPEYSIYSEGSWSTPTAISESINADVDVNLCYNSSTGDVIATWATGSNQPAYGVYSGGTWTTVGTFDTSAPARNVSVCYDPSSNLVVAAWQGTSGDQAYYATYNGTWSSASTITDLPAGSEITLAYDSGSEQVFAFWTDNSTGYATYASFNGATWSSASSFATSSTPASEVYGCYDPANELVFATWEDNVSNQAIYATYSGGTWSGAANIYSSSDSADSSVFLSYNSQVSGTIATWFNNENNQTYSIFTANPSPPSRLTGQQQANNFGVVKEWCNILNWSASPSSGVASYTIYRNGSLIATVGASTFEYEDHDRPKNVSTVYEVYAVDGSGNASSAVTVTIL